MLTTLLINKTPDTDYTTHIDSFMQDLNRWFWDKTGGWKTDQTIIQTIELAIANSEHAETIVRSEAARRGGVVLAFFPGFGGYTIANHGWALVSDWSLAAIAREPMPNNLISDTSPFAAVVRVTWPNGGFGVIGHEYLHAAVSALDVFDPTSTSIMGNAHRGWPDCRIDDLTLAKIRQSASFKLTSLEPMGNWKQWLPPKEDTTDVVSPNPTPETVLTAEKRKAIRAACQRFGGELISLLEA